MQHTLTLEEFNKAHYVQSVVQVIQGLRLHRYQTSLHIVTPQFGGLWKFKLTIKGKQSSLPFNVTLPMLDSYAIDELIAVIVKRLKSAHVEPFDKAPAMKLATLPTPGKSSVHPTSQSSVAGKVDLKQVVRMTCCNKPNPGAPYWLCQLQEAIIHLNDDHQWKREQIADWLETTDADITIN